MRYSHLGVSNTEVERKKRYHLKTVIINDNNEENNDIKNSERGNNSDQGVSVLT